MRIKKINQTPLPTSEASIIDAYSTSTTDGYSCNYVNQQLQNVGKDIISIGLSANVLLPQEAIFTHQKVPFDTILYSRGNNLTFTNNEIVVGDNVNHIKATFCTSIFGYNNGTFGELYSRIKKNNNDVVTSMLLINNFRGGGLNISNYIIPVTKNDVLNCYISANSTTRKQIEPSNTYMTLEVID